MLHDILGNDHKYNWSNISLNPVIEVDFITYFDFITKFREASKERLQRTRLANRTLTQTAPDIWSFLIWDLH